MKALIMQSSPASHNFILDPYILLNALFSDTCVLSFVWEDRFRNYVKV
jgi:hypothetical protein